MQVTIGEKEQEITRSRREAYLISGVVSLFLGVVLLGVGFFYLGSPLFNCGSFTCSIHTGQIYAGYVLMAVGGLLLGLSIPLLAVGSWLSKYAWVTR